RVRPTTVVIAPPAQRAYGVRVEARFLMGLAQRGDDHVLVAVARAAGQPPGVAFVRPRCPVLNYGPLPVVDQQTGGAEPAPVPVSAIALHPTVPVSAGWAKLRGARRLRCSLG